MEKIIIRKAEINDLADILRLNLDLFKKEHKEYDNRMNLKWTYGKVGKTYFQKRISGRDGFVVVAEISENIVGYLCGGLRKDPYTYRTIQKYTELENMMVDKKFRSQGIGGKMAKKFLTWCKSNKADCISVNASAQNKKAIRFYRKMGFKDYSSILEIK